jgi:hypothetical protein
MRNRCPGDAPGGGKVGDDSVKRISPLLDQSFGMSHTFLKHRIDAPSDLEVEPNPGEQIHGLLRGQVDEAFTKAQRGFHRGCEDRRAMEI